MCIGISHAGLRPANSERADSGSLTDYAGYRCCTAQEYWVSGSMAWATTFYFGEGDLPELVRLREPARDDAARLSARAAIVVQLRRREGAAVGVLQTLAPGKHPRIGQPAILVALQDDSAPTAKFGCFLEREDQELAVLAQHSDGITCDKGTGLGLDAGR